MGGGTEERGDRVAAVFPSAKNARQAKDQRTSTRLLSRLKFLLLLLSKVKGSQLPTTPELGFISVRLFARAARQPVHPFLASHLHAGSLLAITPRLDYYSSQLFRSHLLRPLCEIASLRTLRRLATPPTLLSLPVPHPRAKPLCNAMLLPISPIAHLPLPHMPHQLTPDLGHSRRVTVTPSLIARDVSDLGHGSVAALLSANAIQLTPPHSTVA
ncbi:unnamed protein product [Cutaneotrichosporon oleaginosum]